MRAIRSALVGMAIGLVGLLPLRRITPRLKPSSRARLWRFLASAVARGQGMAREISGEIRPVAGTGPVDVLLVSDALYPERGGGTRSMMRMARRLADAGRTVAAVCGGPERKCFGIDGIEMHWITSAEELPKFILSRSARRLLVQQAWAPIAAEAARAAAIPYWYFVRSTEELLGDAGEATGASGLGGAIRAASDFDPVSRASAAVIAGAERVVANSRFMAEVILAGFGRRADVLYPEVDEPMPWEARRSALSQCIVAVATTNKKGVGILLELAKAFPDEIFLLCGFKELTPFLQSRIDKKVVRNLVPLGQLPTPATYALAKLVLVPSQWPEPFGRVNAEALLRGIPVLASRVGGMPEVVVAESLQVPDFKNPGAWAARLRDLLGPSALRSARAAVMESAAAYGAMVKQNGGLIADLIG